MARTHARDRALAQRASGVLFAPGALIGTCAERGAARRGSFRIAQGSIHDVLPVLPVAILNQHRDRRTEGLAGPHTRQEFDGVLLDLHPSSPAVSLLPAHQFCVHVIGEEGKPGWDSLEDTDERGTV